MYDGKEFVERVYTTATLEEKAVLIVLYDNEDLLSDGFRFYNGYQDDPKDDHKDLSVETMLNIARKLIEAVKVAQIEKKYME